MASRAFATTLRSIARASPRAAVAARPMSVLANNARRVAVKSAVSTNIQKLENILTCNDIGHYPSSWYEDS